MDISYKGGYVPELDGLRGFAILAVMMSHTHIHAVRGGFIGVDIFFVLSGYLITSLLVKEFDACGSISFKNFYMRRVLRLAPALILMLLCYSVFVFVQFGGGENGRHFKSVLYALFYSSNWVRAFNLHNMGLLSHTWSLSIEEQFYILWPVTLVLMLRRIESRKKIMFIILSMMLLSWLLRVIMASNGAPANRLYNGLDTRADALLAGCVIGIAHASGILRLDDRLRGFRGIITAGAAFFFIVVITNVGWSNMAVFYWIEGVAEICAVLLLLNVFASPESRFNRLLKSGPAVWLGTLSYGVYLWHDPVYKYMIDSGYSGFTVAAAGTVISLSLASASYYILEKPVLKLKKRLQNGYRSETISKRAAINIPSE